MMNMSCKTNNRKAVIHHKILYLTRRIFQIFSQSLNPSILRAGLKMLSYNGLFTPYKESFPKNNFEINTLVTRHVSTQAKLEEVFLNP